MKILFLFLYLVGADVWLEKEYFNDPESCLNGGKTRIEEVMLTKPESTPLYATCVAVPVQEVSSSNDSAKENS